LIATARFVNGGFMTVLIAFPGTQDPYLLPSSTKPGPILSLLGQRSFDTIRLYSTPATSQETHACKAAIETMHPGSQVAVYSSRLEDRTDIIAVRNMLDDAFSALLSSRKWAKFIICVPTDWPQMYTALLSLAEREARRVTLLEVKVAPHVSTEPPEVKEIRLRGDVTEHLACYDSAFGKRVDEDDESVLYAQRDFTHAAMRRYALSPSERTEGPDYLGIAKEMGIIGEEPCVREMLYTAYRFALRSIPVLITGETGTGKDLLARYVHRLSPRCEDPASQ
jgi:transcriptional regulator with PAS, ATPase and Fis domain